MTIEYIGSTSWDTDTKDAERAWQVTGDERSNVHPDADGRQIRYVEAEADTGCRYVVVATPMGPVGRAGLGGPVLVTVYSPWNDSWALQEHGLLTSNYVAEHLTDGRWRDSRLNGGDLAALTMTIAHALGRPHALNL